METYRILWLGHEMFLSRPEIVGVAVWVASGLLTYSGRIYQCIGKTAINLTLFLVVWLGISGVWLVVFLPLNWATQGSKDNEWVPMRDMTILGLPIAFALGIVIGTAHLTARAVRWLRERDAWGAVRRLAEDAYDELHDHVGGAGIALLLLAGLAMVVYS